MWNDGICWWIVSRRIFIFLWGVLLLIKKENFIVKTETGNKVIFREMSHNHQKPSITYTVKKIKVTSLWTAVVKFSYKWDFSHLQASIPSFVYLRVMSLWKYSTFKIIREVDSWFGVLFIIKLSNPWFRISNISGTFTFSKIFSNCPFIFVNLRPI